MRTSRCSPRDARGCFGARAGILVRASPRPNVSEANQDGPIVHFVRIHWGRHSLSHASYEAIQNADVVFRDRYVDKEVESVFSWRAQVIDCDGGGEAWAKKAARRALRGERVVRMFGNRAGKKGRGWEGTLRDQVDRCWIEEASAVREQGVHAILLPWVEETALALASSSLIHSPLAGVEIDWTDRRKTDPWDGDVRFLRDLELCDRASDIAIRVVGRNGVDLAANALMQGSRKDPQQSVVLVVFPTTNMKSLPVWRTSALLQVSQVAQDLLEEDEGVAILLLGEQLNSTQDLRQSAQHPDVQDYASPSVPGSDVYREDESLEEIVEDSLKGTLAMVDEEMRGEMVLLRNELAHLQLELQRRDEEVEALWDEAAAVLAQEVEKVQEEVVQREQEIMGLEGIVRDQSKTMEGVRAQVLLLLEVSRKAKRDRDG